MSAEATDAAGAMPPGAAPLFARADAADRRAAARLATAIEDFCLARQDRLDDRTRAAVADAIAALVGSLQAAIADRSPDGATSLAASDVLPRLVGSDLMRDPSWIGEVLAQVRLDLLDDSLAANRAPDAAQTLLVRLSGCGDAAIEAAATDYLLADSRRIGPRRVDLPASALRTTTWWVAAAMREAIGHRSAATDRALVEAASHVLAAQDGAPPLAAAAARLATAIDARPDELGKLLIDALAEGRAALAVALLARAQGIDVAVARELILDPDGDHLWLALRTHGLTREAIARIGLALADADHRRDIEAFADQLDAIAEVTPQDARAALAPLALPRAFRDAIDALARTPLGSGR